MRGKDEGVRTKGKDEGEGRGGREGRGGNEGEGTKGKGKKGKKKETKLYFKKWGKVPFYTNFLVVGYYYFLYSHIGTKRPVKKLHHIIMHRRNNTILVAVRLLLITQLHHIIMHDVRKVCLLTDCWLISCNHAKQR